MAIVDVLRAGGIVGAQLGSRGMNQGAKTLEDIVSRSSRYKPFSSGGTSSPYSKWSGYKSFVQSAQGAPPGLPPVRPFSGKVGDWFNGNFGGMKGIGGDLRDNVGFTKRHLWSGGIGAATGAVLGGAGNLVAPEVGTTDSNIWRNAIKGAAIGAGMGLLHGTARNITNSTSTSMNPWLLKGAHMTNNAMKSIPFMGAIATAGFMGSYEGHLTQANNRINGL
jgi:hypothetical protein